MFLPGLPIALIRACYAAAPGNEIATGKFDNRRSSAALAANTFGKYLGRPQDMPRLPAEPGDDWPACQVQLEATLRFPWPGGRHPCLDVLITTAHRVIGIESKRFEPFRSTRGPRLSDAYWRPLWGSHMKAFEELRDRLRDADETYHYIDATELVRHAFGLRTMVHRDPRRRGLAPVLLYLYAEPSNTPDGRTIAPEAHEAHRAELAKFARTVRDDEVTFCFLSYRELLDAWAADSDPDVACHAAAVMRLFAP
ncbi:MAG: hypothetical protein P4L71_11485 [Acetobacteraceae bacterium]|nr:hypothetical protein [Acetobacteraceae bacterium]